MYHFFSYYFLYLYLAQRKNIFFDKIPLSIKKDYGCSHFTQTFEYTKTIN